MKSQWILALLAATLALVVAGAANAQGAPVYMGPARRRRSNRRAMSGPSRCRMTCCCRGRSSASCARPDFRRCQRRFGAGGSTLSPRSHPDGEDGQVTIDAITGRFIRFVPADLIGRSMASYPPPPYAPPRRGVSRPPMPLPGVAVAWSAPTSAAVAGRSGDPQTANAATTNSRSNPTASLRTARRRAANAREIRRSGRRSNRASANRPMDRRCCRRSRCRRHRASTRSDKQESAPAQPGRSHFLEPKRGRLSCRRRLSWRPRHLLGRAVADRNAARLLGFRNLADEIDVEQTVLKCGALHVHMVGQLEYALESTGGDATIQQIGFVLGILVAGSRP